MAHYLDNDELAEELEKCKANGCEPSVELCMMFRQIAEHLLTTSRYNRYPLALREDLASCALERMIKSIHLFDPERADTCFSYWTRIAETSFWRFL